MKKCSAPVIVARSAWSKRIRIHSKFMSVKIVADCGAKNVEYKWSVQCAVRIVATKTLISYDPLVKCSRIALISTDIALVT